MYSTTCRTFWLDDHLLRPLERMTAAGEGVEQRHVGGFGRLATRFELDDTNSVGIRLEHRGEAPHDDLVVVDDRHRQRVPEC